jgi:hypothetical protein
VPHDPAYSDRARVSVADRAVSVGPMADAIRPGRHQRHLARSGENVPRCGRSRVSTIDSGDFPNRPCDRPGSMSVSPRKVWMP